MGPAGSAESPPAAEKHSWRRTAVMAVAAAIFAAVWGRGGPIFAALAVLCMLPVLLKIEEEWEPVAPGMQAQQKLQDQVAAALGTDSRASTPGKAGASGQALKSMGTVYFGTQRGQSRRFAEALVTSAAQAGLHLKLADMTSEDPEATLHDDPLVIFVLSTYVDGTPPEGAAWFCRWIAEAAVDERVGNGHLASTRFAVLGCGNSLYGDNFNRAARDLDAALSALGGRRLVPMGSVDEDSGVDVSVQFRAWAARLIQALSAFASASALEAASAAAGIAPTQARRGRGQSTGPAAEPLGAKAKATRGVISAAVKRAVDAAAKQMQAPEGMRGAEQGEGNWEEEYAAEEGEEGEEEEEWETDDGVQHGEEEGGSQSGDGAAGGRSGADSTGSAREGGAPPPPPTGDTTVSDSESAESHGDSESDSGGDGGGGADDGVGDLEDIIGEPLRDGPSGRAGARVTRGKPARPAGGAGASVGPGSEASADERKQMVTPTLRAHLTKQGYRVLGSHSGVKLCRWTKSMLRGRGGCYKHAFYGIESHRCMEATPSLACAKHHTNPVGREWKWQMDAPDQIVEGALSEHRSMVKQMRGVPGVLPQRLEEGMAPRHCALSLVGEPIMYPEINTLLGLLHGKRISTFLVTNAQFPDAIKNLKPITQLYVSVDAATPDTLKAIDRPLFSDFWERFVGSLSALKEKRQRTVYRLTLVAGWNITEAGGYADLVALGEPDFIEIKGVTYCGAGNGASSLTMANVPYHKDVVEFAQAVGDRVREKGLGDYGLACEHAHSCCVLLARRDRYWRDGGWHTWIDYEKFQDLAASGKPFSSEEYIVRTPDWAVAGSEEAGFDPAETRFKKERRHGGKPGDVGGCT